MTFFTFWSFILFAFGIFYVCDLMCVHIYWRFSTWLFPVQCQYTHALICYFWTYYHLKQRMCSGNLCSINVPVNGKCISSASLQVPVLVGEADSPGVFRLASLLLLRRLLPLGDDVTDLRRTRVLFKAEHLLCARVTASVNSAPWCLLADSAPDLALSGHRCKGWIQTVQFSSYQCPGLGDTETHPLWWRHQNSPPMVILEHKSKATTSTFISV